MAPGVWITEMLYNQIMVVRCSPHNPALISSLQTGNRTVQIALIIILQTVCYLVCIISLVVQVLKQHNIKCMQKNSANDGCNYSISLSVLCLKIFFFFFFVGIKRIFWPESQHSPPKTRAQYPQHRITESLWKSRVKLAAKSP